VLCLIGFTASIVLFYPGDYGYDTLTQCTQSETGLYGDWHPPVMAAMWKLFRNGYCAVTGETVRGNGMMYSFHTLLVWAGILGVLVSAKSFWKRDENSQPSRLSVLVIVFLLSWMLFSDLLYRSRDISKDLGMMGAYLLATGFLFHWPTAVWKRILRSCLILLLLFYGTALRHNAVFALIPMLCWLSWHIVPKKHTIPILMSGMVLWIVMLGTIQWFNYRLLNTVPLYPLQERFYTDILQLNYRTNHFIAPPNTFGNDFSSLDESQFRQKFQPDIVFIQNAFKDVNAELPYFIWFTQNQTVILSHEEFIQHQNDSFFIDDFLGSEKVRMRIFDESAIRTTFPGDYQVLRHAWINRIMRDPVVYIKWKTMVFIKYCQKTSMSFWGLSISTILMLTVCLAAVCTFSQKRYDASVCPSLMLGWSAILYILPLWIVIPDDREMRYVYYFLAASLIAMVFFCSNSQLMRSLLQLVTSSWETKLRDIVDQSTKR